MFTYALALACLAVVGTDARLVDARAVSQDV